MKPLKIEAYDTLPTPGDLKAIVSGDALLLPELIVDELKKMAARTPEDLLSVMRGSPSRLARLLDWTQEDVDRASALLRNQLEGRIHPGYLEIEKRPRPRVRFGARTTTPPKV